MKVIPKIKVSEMEFIEGNGTREIYERNGAYLSGGGLNYYRVTFMKGQGGSRTESTWDRDCYWHTCCQSKVPWRHKTGCPKLEVRF